MWMRLSILSLSLSILQPFLSLDLVASEKETSNSTPTPRDSDANNRFNVLLICVDDLRPELGCYGATWADSPHLDQFAETAVTFRRHYVQVPTCGASRYALLTGRSPRRSGVTANNQAFYSGRAALTADELPGAQSMPELFRRSGYETVCVGKISHTPDGRVFAYNGSGDGRDEVPNAWDRLPTPFGEWQRGWGIFFAYANGEHREDGQNHRELFQFSVAEDNELPDGMIADQAKLELRRLRDSAQPFFLGVGFFKPHLPFVAPQNDWDRFEENTIPAAAQPTRTSTAYWHRSSEFFQYRMPFEKKEQLENEAAQQTRRAYQACVRYVDRQVGAVLDELDALGLADNTIVVVWGDHGWHLGEQAIWGKHTPLERALRSALMIRVPEAAANGTQVNELVETIDIYPTLVEACQPRFQGTQEALDGTSLLTLLQGESETRDTATSYWRNAVSVRTDEFRVIGQRRQQTADEDEASREWEKVELYDHRGEFEPDGRLIDLQDLPDSTRKSLEDILEGGNATQEFDALFSIEHAANPDMLRLENLVAWCVVPFDAEQRSPRQRAQMLKELGFRRLAYDWRQEHVDEFEEEIRQLREHEIELFAFWDEHPEMFRLCEEFGLQPQFWKMIPQPPTDLEHSQQVRAAGERLLPLLRRCQQINATLGLYNHGGWGGDPHNMIAVCRWLREHADTDQVGIVYNLHHAHQDLERLEETLPAMVPYLLCLNLNGMNARPEPKILPLGSGTEDERVMRLILTSGYTGPIGILDHRNELDAKRSLEQNLEGLKRWQAHSPQERQDEEIGKLLPHE